MKISRRVAFCGIVCALSLLWMFMTVFPYGTVAMVALAGLMLVPAALEVGLGHGWACFGVTLALALVLVPDPSAKLLFACFFGYYPLIQLRVNLWIRPIIKWIVKFSILNTALIIAYFAAAHWSILRTHTTLESSLWLITVIMPILNAVFFIYDMTLWHLIGFYRIRIHPLIQRIL